MCMQGILGFITALSPIPGSALDSPEPDQDKMKMHEV